MLKMAGTKFVDLHSRGVVSDSKFCLSHRKSHELKEECRC